MPERDEPRQYHVLATLGEIGSSSTYKVSCPQDGSLWVARRIAIEQPRATPAMRRLARDVAVASRFAHPALAAWREADLRGKGLVLLRQWVEGTSLARHPRFATAGVAGSPAALADPGELEGLAVALLEALHALHSRGLLARRLAPANVFLRGTGELQLTDWGVRFLPGNDPAGREFEAPELAAGRAADVRSDLYAAGALLHVLASGRPPALHGPSPDLAASAALADAGGPLAGLLQALLMLDPCARPASARDALSRRGRVLGGVVSGTRFRCDRLVGRETEMRELRATVGRLLSGQGDLVFVRGDVGVGKTRLLEELGRHAALRGACVLDGAEPDASGYPFARLGRVFEGLAVEMGTWSEEELSSSLPSDSRVLLEASSEFHALPALRALPEPPTLGAEAARRRLLRVAARALELAARRRPLVILLDDLEGSDALALDLSRYVARQLVRPEGGRRPSPILVVASYREEADASSRGPLRAAVVALRAKGLAREIVLKALAPHEVRDLLVDRLGSDALPCGFLSKVMAETAGRPILIEEMLGTLSRDGALERDPGGWIAAWEAAKRPGGGDPDLRGADDEVALLLGTSVVEGAKSSPTSLLAHRFRAIEPDLGRVLETAALAGPNVTLDVLRAGSGLGESAFDEALATALADGTLREEAPDAFTFRHEKLLEACVGCLDASRQRAVHERIGVALEQQVGSLDERTPLRLAHHFHLAGDVERSILYLPIAARILKERHAPLEALALFKRFFRMLQSLEPGQRERHLVKRLQAMQAMAETLGELERGTEASSVYREMAALAEGNNRDRELVTAWSGLAALSLEQGDLEAAERFSRRAMDVAKRAEQGLLVAANLTVLGTVAFLRQETDQAIWDLSGALRLCRESKDELGASRALVAIGDVYAARYVFRRALSAYRTAHRQFRRMDDKVGVSLALNRLGRTFAQLGDGPRALAYHREALRLEREADDRKGVGATLDLLGEAYRLRGDLPRAEETLKEALVVKREVADVRGSAETLLNLGTVELQAGRIEEGTERLEQALTLARRAGNARAEAGALVRLAQARVQRGEGERAVEQAEEGLARARSVLDRPLECRALLVLSQATTGQPALAAALRARSVAEALGQRELQFRACMRAGDLQRELGRDEEAFEQYEKALDSAGAHVAAARSAREGFLKRVDVRSGLEEAATFVGRGGGDLVARFPVLRFARETDLAAV